MNTDLYGFQEGELVQLMNQPMLFGRVLGHTSGEGRLRVKVLFGGRYRVFGVLPTCLKSLTKSEEQS